MIRLTDEEFNAVYDRWLKIKGALASDLASMMLKAQLKKVVEYLLDNELIPAYKGDFIIPNEKFQALLEEIKEVG